MTPTLFPAMVDAECRRAAVLHAGLANHDEALSVLSGEVDEVQREVYKKPSTLRPEDLLAELVQTAAVARRWAECCGLTVALGAPFPGCVAGALACLRRIQIPAASDHEHLTRLKRLAARLWGWAVESGPTLAGRQADAGLALAALAATCQRWAEERGLVPPDPATPPEFPGVECLAPPVELPPPAPDPADAPTGE